MEKSYKKFNHSRRTFVKNSALLGGTMMAMPFASHAGYFTSVDDSIKVALIGCGGRGTGAAMQALLSKQNVKIVAMADAFRDRLDKSYKALISENDEGVSVKDAVTVPEENKFLRKVSFSVDIHSLQAKRVVSKYNVEL